MFTNSEVSNPIVLSFNGSLISDEIYVAFNSLNLNTTIQTNLFNIEKINDSGKNFVGLYDGFIGMAPPN